MLAKIKEGSVIFHDRFTFKWPECVPPESEYESEEYQYKTKHPDAVFEVKPMSRGYWECKKVGYGAEDEYGNGSIFAKDILKINLK